MSVPRAKVIINPVAGAGSTHRKWPLIRKLLRSVGLTFEHEFTEDKGHAIKIAQRAASDGFQYLVAVGGDGTVHEVANGILRAGNGKNIALGIVSTGTGSDLGRSIGTPHDFKSACSCLMSPRRLTIDVGVVEYTRNGTREQRFFVNAAGAGFDATVVQNVERLPKYFGGTIPYLFGVLRTFLFYRNKLVLLRIGDRVESRRILNMVVANGGYLGGGMHVTPDARVDDSLLDVMVVGDITKFELLKTFPRVYKGTHVTHPAVRMSKTTQVTVESSEPFLVHADGELLGAGPASFSILPAALNIVV